MSIWSRLSETPIGSALSATLSALWRAVTGRDSNHGEHDHVDGGIVFTIGVIALAAKMARADGAVTADEIEVVHRLFHVPERERRNVQRFFDVARSSMAGFESYAEDLARLFADRPGVLEDVLDGLFAIALADGSIHPSELDYLGRAAEIFGFSEGEFARLCASHLSPEGDPFRVLGLDPDCNEDELKRAYRRLVKENHPDSLIARGVPDEFVAVATAKLAAINRAYDEIKRLREPA